MTPLVVSVRVLVDTYPMFIEPRIARVASGFSGYIHFCGIKKIV